jgi:Asp-tRNA(Asn)/Glu-tRNA(Gln) amidotransferase B subunit
MNEEEENQMVQACLHPSDEAVMKYIKQIPNWHLYKTDIIMGHLMRALKGTCNPAMLREQVERLTYGYK